MGLSDEGDEDADERAVREREEFAGGEKERIVVPIEDDDDGVDESFRRRPSNPFISHSLLFFLLRLRRSSPFRFLPPPKHQNGSGRHCRRDQQGPRRHQDREDRQARREEGGK